MTTPTALIFGISGQDGSYMAEFLWSKGYRVVGTSRDPERAAERLAPFGLDEVEIQQINMRESAGLAGLIDRVQPNEVYNFAAFSTGSGMYDNPVDMGDVNGLAVVRILDAIRHCRVPVRFCQASSSEMFRETGQCPQDEGTPLTPASPYGAAKIYAHQSIGVARRRENAFACSAILFQS